MKRLKDIAEETGYSIKTVSRAIHNHPDIRRETRLHIMEVVRKHGFSPQWAAQSLRIRKTHTVGFIVPNVTNSFFGQLAMTIDGHFRTVGYGTFICFTAKSRENELDSLGLLLGKNVDGIIFAPSGRSVDYFEALPPLREKPLVIIDNRCEKIDAYHVLHDNSFGMKLLVDHLIGLGHRSVAFVGGPLEESSAAERLAGYRMALTSHRIPINESLIRIADWEQINSGHEATIDLLQTARGRFTAILYGNSQLLLGGYKAIHALGLRMPKDVAVAGFDPPSVIDSLAPRPTTLGNVEEKIGLAAAHILQDLMSGEKGPAKKEIRIRSKLHIGESTANVLND